VWGWAGRLCGPEHPDSYFKSHCAAKSHYCAAKSHCAADLGMQEAGARINSIDFHRVEDILVTGSTDDTIHVYNIANGALRSTLLSRKYGVSHINCTHNTNAVLFASAKVRRCTNYAHLLHSACVSHVTATRPPPPTVNLYPPAFDILHAFLMSQSHDLYSPQ
jgi:WD40 repeat protein